MTASHRVDPVAGRAFFASGPLFACTLAAPDPHEPRRSAAMAFAFPADALDEALAFARNALGRNHAMVIERVSLGAEAWPAREPRSAADCVVERGGFVVLAPSVEAWVTMPPARPHHLVQLVAAGSTADEAAMRAVLASFGGCGLVGRVLALVHGDSGADIDAVTVSASGLRAGWFVAEAPPEAATPDHAATAPIATNPAPAHPPTGDALFDAALAAYLSPHQNEKRLDAWLLATAPGADAAAVRHALDAAVATATDALWNETPAVHWTAAFEHRFVEHVAARHPWLDATGRPALLAYARWLCWHEGLGSPRDADAG